MVNMILPRWVKESNIEYKSLDSLSDGFMENLKNDLKKFRVDNPEVSIVIPSYNEEKDIIKTLFSLSKLNTKHKTELIVSNNNSTDRTQEILDKLEIKSVFVTNQGISYARQAGLEAAKGKFILNADSDSIYPINWTDPFVEALKNKNISCAYGSYSFIPSMNSRMTLAMYEMTARTFFKLKRQNKDRECVNVMGFNFAFRKEDGIKVGGYNHNLQRKITERSEDGWMALTLMQVGKLKFIEDSSVNVWTSDRRLMADGSLGKAFAKRVKKEISRIGLYLKPTSTI